MKKEAKVPFDQAVYDANLRIGLNPSVAERQATTRGGEVYSVTKVGLQYRPRVVGRVRGGVVREE